MNASKIWNRACHGGGASPGVGDAALAAMLAFHSEAMNNGVLTAMQRHPPADLKTAVEGYRYFGLDRVVAVLEGGQRALDAGEDPDELAHALDEQLHEALPTDEKLYEAFSKTLALRVADFNPL